MKAALIGPPQSGKSTLFAAISGRPPAPSGTPKIEEAVVKVPDPRLEWLTKQYQPKRVVEATIDCFDVPGLSFTDDGARSSARRNLAEVRTADLFVMVIRSFDSDTVPPYRSRIDPARDLRELHDELLLADLELVSNRITKLSTDVKKASKTQERDRAELDLQLRLQEALEAEKPARTVITDDRELELIKSLGLYTLKPAMVAVNIGEAQLTSPPDLQACVDRSIPVLTLSAQIEHELGELDADSRAEFMADLGIAEPARARFVRACYEAMGLISFLTVGPDEVRAWPVRRGISAHLAAGKIHSDIQRGFIRAETMSFEELQKHGNEKTLRAAGRVRLEGKEYIVQDGDIMEFRFNV